MAEEGRCQVRETLTDPNEPLTDAQFAKLPRWARLRMGSLERQRDELRKVVQGFRDQHPGTDTFISNYGESDTTLPKGARVRFNLYDIVDRAYSHDYVVVRREGNHIDIHGGDMLEIHPTAGNGIEVSIRDRRVH